MPSMIVSTVTAVTTRCLPSTTASCVRNRSMHLPLSSTLHLIARNSAKSSIDFSKHEIGRYFLSASTAGRSRKRPRPWQRSRKRNDSLSSSGGETISKESTRIAADTPLPTTSTIERSEPPSSYSDESSLPYPKGKPWRVLWPRPHGIPNEQEPSIWELHKRMPTKEQIERGWSLYKETWEDGITGIPTKRKENKTATNVSSEETTSSRDDASESPILTKDQLHEIGDNAAKNLKIVRKDAHELLEHTKVATGIHTQDDLKALVSEAMKIATECIREFMAGYRSGRDSEIDKMLHEYFQDVDENEEDEKTSAARAKESSGESLESPSKISNGDKTKSAMSERGRKKKRKPKRGIPRE